MQTQSTRQTEIRIVPQSWYGRLLAVLAGGVLLVLGLFFFVLFLIAGAALVAAFAARLMWIQRKLKKETSQDIIDAEYSVEGGEERLAKPVGTLPRPEDADRGDH
jgi:predicted lipid-binding transport protein (Tim44 family)